MESWGRKGLSACTLGIGEGVCVTEWVRTGGLGSTDEGTGVFAQGAMRRGRGSSAGRLEAGEGEDDWRGAKSEEEAAALAARTGEGVEGKWRGCVCEKGATLHLAPGRDAAVWIRNATQGGRGLLTGI